jgi:diguanylate cyclase (GGDEF)-like protein
VGEENKTQLNEEIAKTNLIRGRIIALTLIAIELCVITLRLILSPEKVLEPPWSYYYILYVALIVYMTAALIFLEWSLKKKNRNVKLMNAITYISAAFVLAWNMSITLIDVYTGGYLLSYFLALIAVGVILYLKPIPLMIIYLSVHSVYIVLLTHITSQSAVEQGDYINTSIAVVITIFIGLMNYRSKVIVFIQKKTIEQKNKLLKKLNDELTKTNKILEYLSQTDGLTGIHNRRMFDELSKECWDACTKDNTRLSVIMMDIDHFKEYNDNFGHQAGDECLIELVNCLKKTAESKETMLARYGGEEFIMMVCGITPKAAYKLAERIRVNVEKLDIKREYKVVADHITLSLGVYCGIPSEESSVSEFIERADRALYFAKQNKRNNTKVFE